MYRPSKYNISIATLEFWAKRFNNCLDNRNLEWTYIAEESYDNDGYFIDKATGNTMGYDWEIRDKYFLNGEFPYSTLGQFERKLIKPSIKVTIQGDRDCTAIIVAWHEDFLKEAKYNVNLATDTNKKQNGYTRYTDKFKIYRLENIASFKHIISWSINNKIYNHRAFEII